MKKIIYSMFVLSLFILPACNSNSEHDEDYADTATLPGFDDVNYNDMGGGTPVLPDSTPAADNTDQLPGNETAIPVNTGKSGGSSGENNGRKNIDKNGTSSVNKTNDNTENTASTLSRKQGFKVSGQYDSRVMGKRPKPINTDDRYYKENPPAHSYGDTAPRHDGVNSVR